MSDTNLLLPTDPEEQRRYDIEVIHQGTAIYTNNPEVEALLDDLGWPHNGHRLLDPGAGNGAFVIPSLARLDLRPNDLEGDINRVHGYEFHEGAVAEARMSVARHLVRNGWSSSTATEAAQRVIERIDFLLDDIPKGKFDIIAANPPYWRLLNIPPSYRRDFLDAVPRHASADLMHAYVARAAEIVATGGRIGLIASDRLLLNSSSGELRRRLGEQFSAVDLRRLDAESAFYRPKQRRAGTPARVHPISVVLTTDQSGRKLTADPLRVDDIETPTGESLDDLVNIELAPWLGPDGIFTVGSPTAFRSELLVPVVRPTDVIGETGELKPTTQWALITDANKPAPEILRHLDAQLHRMPPRGQRSTRWLPPEPFAGRLPLDVDAVMVPRIAKRLKPVRLPAGRLPVNHNLVLEPSTLSVERLIAILESPELQRQAEQLSVSVDNGYRSFSATLLRQLVVPKHLLTADFPARQIATPTKLTTSAPADDYPGLF